MQNRSSNIGFYIVLLLIYLAPSVVIDFFLFDDTDYANLIGGQVSSSILDAFKANLRKWRILGYATTLLFLFAKTLIVGIVLWLGLFLSDKRTRFKKVWKATVIGQMVFSLRGYLLLVTLIFSKDLNLENFQPFDLLSLAGMFNTKEIPTYWQFVLQSLNLFEVAYWFLLAFFLSKELKSTFNDGLKIVVSSYIPAFVLWLVTVTFFLVSNS